MKYDQEGEIRCPRNRKSKSNEGLLGKLPTKLPSNLEVTFRAICDDRLLGDRPEFLEIGDMLRVNFYRPSYKKNGDKHEKTAINSKIGDKSAINQNVGDKLAINYKDKILEYLSKHSEARSQDIALFIGLKQSRTKDYLSELVEEGKIVANGANRNRTYSLENKI